MSGTRRQQPSAGAVHPPPPSPTSKGTSKYTNKDGSKFITVPKASSSTTDSAQPSPSLPAADSKSATQSDQAGPGSPSSAQPVNRKKQKRRAKAAAKALAEQTLNKEDPPSPTDSAAPSHDRRSLDVEYDLSEAEDEPLTSNDHRHGQENGRGEPAKSKKSKKKKKKAAEAGGDDTHAHHDYRDYNVHSQDHDRSHSHTPHPPPVHRGAGISKEKIWNTSSQEERERIKEFWLGLAEDERKSLVKVEKDAVLKKMKEQQKHTCSCTVCGRKRTAIEEELEGLYDAYYQELEQYAHRPNQNSVGPPMMPYPRTARPSRGRIVERDEHDEDNSYSEGDPEEDEVYSEDEPPEVNQPSNAPDDFNLFGNSLTVQGGILTVADDLLKNDGRKFIEMMEQLAERRMAREEDAKEAYARTYSHTNGGAYGRGHAPPEEDEYEDEEEEEEYEEGDDEEYDSNEEEQDDTMTEAQRMEEGRRMFQIFAARMFEQRVHTAYREKVAKERQQRLLEELDEENRTKDQLRAKKAKEAQKRKDRAAKKKEALAEEKARKEAEKAAEEAARLAEEERKAEEQRQKAEEKRMKREAQRKAEEEERLRKEAERQRRIHEQKERQAEQERKAREAKEKEKKAKEEAARQKEKEAKERKEQEARERKAQQEREKKEREAKSQAEREERETLVQKQQKVLQKVHKQADSVAQKPVAALPTTATPITLARRPAQHAIPTALPALPQQPAAAAVAVASPQIPVATPAIPKAPLTMRRRQPSQQESSVGSSQSTSQSEATTSQAASPHPLTPSNTSPGLAGPPSKGRSASAQGGLLQPLQTSSPLVMPAKTAIPTSFGGFNASPMMPFAQAHPGMHSGPPMGMSSPMHQNHIFPGNTVASPFGNPAMSPMPANMNRPGAGRGFGLPMPPPGFSQPADPHFSAMGPGYQPAPPSNGPSLHHRQSSGGFEPSPSGPSAQPIGRPMPIARPPSAAPGQRHPAASLPNAGWGGNDADNHHLGSSALLDDSEEAAQEFPPAARRNTSVPGSGVPFPNMFGLDSSYNNNVWGAQPVSQQNYYGSPPPGFSVQPQLVPWVPAPGQASSAFGPQSGPARHSQPRSVALRQLLCQACRELSESRDTPEKDRLDDAFVSLEAVKNRVEALNPLEQTNEGELREMCETFGNSANGGGSFEMRMRSGKTYVLWVPDAGGLDAQTPVQRAIGAPGGIGSPIVGSSVFASGNGSRGS